MPAETLYHTIANALRHAEPLVLATRLPDGGAGSAVGDIEKMLVGPNGRMQGGFTDASLEKLALAAALQCLQQAQSEIYSCAKTASTPVPMSATQCSTWRVFLEPLIMPRLVILGGGHISQEVCRLVKRVGFHVTVMDDRGQYVTAARFPDVDILQTIDFSGLPQSGAAPPPQGYYLIVTRGHTYDAACLEWALRQQSRYIGMIGSQGKRDAIYDELRTRGIDESKLRRVHCPVGLVIGARTKEEIAIAIVAELIAVRRQSHVRTGSA